MELRIIRGLNKLPVRDLRHIAHFNRIIKNYEKMLVIERRHKEELKRKHNG